MALIYLFSNKYLHVHLNANRNRVGGVVQVLLNEIQAGLYDFLFSFLLRLKNLNIFLNLLNFMFISVVYEPLVNSTQSSL